MDVAISRIYPMGIRTDSSNYDPTPAWTAGNQMVALNYQTNDLPYQINVGKFQENGNCGYVLKPERMRSLQATGHMAMENVSLQIISGQQLPKPLGAKKGEVVDPFIVVVVSDGSSQSRYETKVVDNNGFNPVWNEEFVIPKILEPALTVLTFQVYDLDTIGKELLAFASFPVSCLSPGLRVVPLQGHKGRTGVYEYASLLVRVAWTKKQVIYPIQTVAKKPAPKSMML